MLEFLESPGVKFFLGIALLVWSSIWAILGMWKAGKKDHKIGFVLIFVSLIGWYLYPNIVTIIIGLFAALPILYFYILSRFKFEKSKLVFERWGKRKTKGKK